MLALAHVVLSWACVPNRHNHGCTRPACSSAFSKAYGIQVSEIMDPEAGHVHRDGVVLACEVLECCPWFEFADLDVYGNTTEEEADDLSTDPDELLELGMHASHMSFQPCIVYTTPWACFVYLPMKMNAGIGVVTFTRGMWEVGKLCLLIVII